MSIRALENINHDGILYKNGEVITEITKEEADRLIDLDVAELVDSKFKESSKNIKKNIITNKKIKKVKEDEIMNVIS